ncbi:hypothetical protein H1C71_018921 [Ictidomys tridecemlineatus]|nr:hypothetical protein H1C71_018921 [Ictidomys tridecemlineatus]
MALALLMSWHKGLCHHLDTTCQHVTRSQGEGHQFHGGFSPGVFRSRALPQNCREGEGACLSPGDVQAEGRDKVLPNQDLPLLWCHGGWGGGRASGDTGEGTGSVLVSFFTTVTKNPDKNNLRGGKVCLATHSFRHLRQQTASSIALGPRYGRTPWRKGRVEERGSAHGPQEVERERALLSKDKI